MPPDLRRASITAATDLRRTSTQMPVTRQVGFHVEGLAESPAHEATLADQHLQAGAVTVGSPSPVTIPPTFQAMTTEAQNAMEARSVLDMRTTSLPLEAAARFLPDSHLARGNADVESSMTASADLSRLELTAKENSNPWEAAAAVNTTGRDPTTRGGMRLGSYAGNPSPLTPVKEPLNESDCDSTAAPSAISHHETGPSGQQPTLLPAHQSDPGDSRALEGQALMPFATASESSPQAASHMPFALAAPRLRSVTDPGQLPQETNFARTSLEEARPGRAPGDGRPPLGDFPMRFDRRQSAEDARHSGDHSSRSSAEGRPSLEGRPSEDHLGAPALEDRSSATLAAIAAAAEAGAAAKGRSPAVTPGRSPQGRSPQLTPTTSSVAAEMAAITGQQRMQGGMISAGGSPRSTSLLYSPHKQQMQSAPPRHHHHQQHVSSQGHDGPSGTPNSSLDGQPGGATSGGTHAQQPKQQRKPPSQYKQPQGPAGQQQQQHQPEGDQQPRKQMSKAERRAMQEGQRAAKAAVKAQAGGGKLKGKGAAATENSRAAASSASAGGGAKDSSPSGTMQHRHTAEASEGAAGTTGGASTSSFEKGGKGRGRQEGRLVPHSAELFSHLQQYKAVSAESVMAEGDSGAASVHPAVLRLGLRLGDGSVRGASGRCAHMMSAFRCVVEDYVTPEGKVLSRDLMSVVNTCIHFLVGCRPLSVGMGNGIKYLKTCISKLELGMPESAAKATVCHLIDSYVQEKIVFAGELLARQALAKLRHDDVILTYSASSVVLAILLKAKQEALRFRVVVVDSRPGLDGRRMLRRLLQAGVRASYLHINSINYVMPEVTKVVLGASSVNSNGTVMSRVGSAAVAMAAEGRGVPVLVCCEAFKFVGKVQLDSITSNELGDPAAVAAASCHPRPSKVLTEWEEQPNLALLNLKYDAMPSEYVSVIVTEFGAIPPTSVPVILREHLLDVGT